MSVSAIVGLAVLGIVLLVVVSKTFRKQKQKEGTPRTGRTTGGGSGSDRAI